MPVQVSSAVPHFKAQAYFRTTEEVRDLTLEDFRGKWLCLFFYPNDFSPLCPTELVAFNRLFPEFQRRACAIAGCSCDSIYAHRAWCDTNPDLADLSFPLLADATKRLAMDYGVLLPDKGVALRGTFLIDPDGLLRFTSVNETRIGRNVDEILRTLDALQTGEPCPCNWHQGEPTLKK